jgi:hypothetical protein
MLRTLSFQNANGTHVLANGTKPMMCVAYELRPQRVQQVVVRPRAEMPDVYDRGNQILVARFVVRREFTNGGALAQFEHTHAQTVGGKGTFITGVRGSSSVNMPAVNWVLEVLGFDDSQGPTALLISYEAKGGMKAVSTPTGMPVPVIR